jgi:hypothetical protein
MQAFHQQTRSSCVFRSISPLPDQLLIPAAGFLARERTEEIVSITQSFSEQKAAVGAIDITNKNAARKDIYVVLAVGAIGVAIFVGGVVAFLVRVKLAEFVFGARVWFGVPVAEVDALKILAMTIQSLVVTAWGAGTACVCFVYALLKWTQGHSQG